MKATIKLIVSVLAVIFVFSVINTGRTLRINKSHGMSMYPLYLNDVSLVRSVRDIGELKPGDVIVYKSEWSTDDVHHRIVSINYENETIYCKGDNNDFIDPQAITLNQVIGKEISIIYNEGSLR